MTPLTWQSLGTAWAMPVPAAVVLFLFASGYLWAARRKGNWPARRTAWFLGGLAVTAIAVGGSVNYYAHALYAMHMVQHLLLIMVAPTLLVLGRPLELCGLRGRFARVVTHPALAFGFYTAVVVGTHLTPFQQYAHLQAVHGLEEVLYVVSGYLLVLAVLGEDTPRRPLAHLTRLVLLLPGMAVDTIVGVSLLMTTRAAEPAMARAWGPDPLTDLHWGGAIMWVGGDLLMAALAIVVITRWVRAPGGNDLGPWLEAARRSAIGSDGEADVDDDEEALRAYNAMLSRLHEHDRR